jgi:putative addiction module component (TIGR02574 family)
MILETGPDVNRITPAQKLLLVTELWNDLTAHPTEVPISLEQIAELDRRMVDYRRDPSRFTTSESIQQRILGQTLAGECTRLPAFR